MESTPSNHNNIDRNGSTHKTPARTPRGQVSTAETPTSRRPVHTPLDRTGPRNLLNSVRRGTSASGGKRANAATPHAKAARRALNDRRTAIFTPGKNRRRSLMNQRETPMSFLRDLGRVLAPTTKPVSSSSSSPTEDLGRSKMQPTQREKENDDYDDLDDELPIDRPRLSLPIDQSDDDDEELRPPRLSGVEEEDYTVKSIELPRRFNNEQPGRLSRGSFGSIRDSRYFNPDEATATIQRESDFFPGFLEGLQTREGDQEEYERIDPDVTRRTTLGRDSDFGLEMPAGLEDQTTFVLSEPALDTAPQPPSDEVPGEPGSFADAAGDDMPEPMDDFSDREPFEDFGDAGSVGSVGSIREGSDEGGLPAVADALSDRGSDIGDVTATATIVQQPTRRIESKTIDTRLLKKRKLVSQHGIEYPSLPSTFVKRVAQTALQSSGLSNKRISTDTLVALTQASEWYFEQLGDDLGAYANHAKRKTIEESDVATLMRRQRLVGSSATMFSLAQKHLPRELLQDMRMPLPPPAKQRRAKRPRDEEGGNDDT